MSDEAALTPFEVDLARHAPVFVVVDPDDVGDPRKLAERVRDADLDRLLGEG